MNDVAPEHSSSNLLTNASPFISYTSVLFDKKTFVVRTINNTESGTTMRKKCHNKECSSFSTNFVYDIRVWIGQIKLVIALLPSLSFYAQFALVYIIEEQDSTKQS